MANVIGEPCIDVTDKACVEECPVDCIGILQYVLRQLLNAHGGQTGRPKRSTTADPLPTLTQANVAIRLDDPQQFETP